MIAYEFEICIYLPRGCYEEKECAGWYKKSPHSENTLRVSYTTDIAGNYIVLNGTDKR